MSTKNLIVVIVAVALFGLFCYWIGTNKKSKIVQSVKYDTVYQDRVKIKTDTFIKNKPVYVYNTHYDTIEKKDTTQVFNDYFLTRIYQNQSIDTINRNNRIDTFARITVRDSISQNKLISQVIDRNFKISERIIYKTTTIVEPQVQTFWNKPAVKVGLNILSFTAGLELGLHLK